MNKKNDALGSIMDLIEIVIKDHLERGEICEQTDIDLNHIKKKIEDLLVSSAKR